MRFYQRLVALQYWSQRLSSFKQLNQSKQTIFWLLLLLVALFITCMLVISSLNLSFSEKAMAELREEQLSEAFYANLDRLNSQQQLLERYTDDLATLAISFHTLHKAGNAGVQAELGPTLKNMLTGFPEAYGIGVWFEPSAGSDAAALSSYVYRSAAQHTRLTLLTGQNVVDHRNQLWYAQYQARANRRSPTEIYLTSAYFNPLSRAAVLTLVKPLYDSHGRLIGMVSTDWHSGRIIDLVSQVQVTPNTFAYLIDRNNRKLSSLSNMEDRHQLDVVMQHIQQSRLIDSLGLDLNALLGGLALHRPTMLKKQLDVTGRQYDLSFAATSAGMLFGIGVPRDEIDAAFRPMRRNNIKILLLSTLIMLALSGLLLFRVVGLMQQLQASYRDELTKLPNRARLLVELTKGRGASLLLVNVDDFKEVNGLFGHDCGDHVLQHLARWLEDCLRSQPWGANNLYRLAADEFAIVAPPMSSDRLMLLLQQLQLALETKRLFWQQQEVPLRITLGAVVQDSYEQGNYNRLITRAKFALQQARQQQRSFVVYQPDQRIEDTYQYNLLWAGYVKEALQDDRVIPYFQPIYDNAANQVSKYECLVRMQLPNGQIANPGQFLDVARKVRLDRELTKVMVAKSFAKFTGSKLEFSINLSYADLLDDSLISFITQKLDEAAIGKQVIFEILESDGIQNYHYVKRFIEEVKARGCRIAIDDFGTGYSNFEHLLRLNVDIIKIDGSLIRYLDTDPVAFKVTQGIVHFAKSLNMTTVAEFVHSEQIQQQVKQLGIDFSQGGYFSMPQAELMPEQTVFNKAPVTEFLAKKVAD